MNLERSSRTIEQAAERARFVHGLARGPL
jgi:hypothetical protein